MLRSDRQKGSYCKEKCKNLLHRIKNALSCLYQSQSHKETSSPQSFYQDYRYNLKREQYHQYKSNLHSHKLSSQNYKSGTFLVDQQNKIRQTLKYFSFFLICEIALIVVCYYIDNSYLSGNSSISDKRNNSILFRILMNIIMIILAIVFYNKLKINIQNIQNYKQHFLSRYKLFRQLLIFIIFSSFSLGLIYVYSNSEIAYFEALICIFIHNYLQQNSKMWSTSLGILLSIAIIIKTASREESISTMITIGFLSFSLIVIIFRVEKNTESCQCRSLSRNKQEKQNQDEEAEEDYEQKFREGQYFSLNYFIHKNKGLCCKKCGKPFKCITDNIQLLEEEVIQILEENKNIGYIMNNIPHGYCIIDKRQQQVLLANSSMINRTSIDIDVLYRYLINLKVKIGNASSLTEIDQNNQRKQYSSSNNSVYPSKQNQQLGFRNNNFNKLNCNFSDKTYNTTNQKKLYNQNYQITNLISQNNNNFQNNNYLNNLNQFQTLTQPQANHEHKENEDNISNYYNQQQNSQWVDIQCQEQNIQQKRITEDSRKSGNIYQRSTQNTVYQKNNQQNPYAPIYQVYDQMRKFSQSQDENINNQHQINEQNQFQFQQFNALLAQTNNNMNIQNNKPPLISGIAERQVHSSENCSFNYTNFDPSPINQARQTNNTNNDKEYLNNNGYNNSRYINNTNELNLMRTQRQSPDYNVYTTMKTEDGFIANNNNTRMGYQFEEQNDWKKQMHQNLYNITEIDSSNIQLFDNKTNLSLRNQNQKIYPQTSMKILQNTDPNEFQQRLAHLSQQLIKHKSQTDTKKKDQDFPKELITLQNDSFNAKPSNIQNIKQSMSKANNSSNYQTFQKRTNSTSINNIKMQELNRKRVLTENVTTTKEYENNLNNLQNDKKDINSYHSYNNYQVNTPKNRYSSGNAVNPSTFPINDYDNMYITSIEDIINYPVMEMNNKYSFKLSEGFGEFTSVSLIKADDHLFYFIFDGNFKILFYWIDKCYFQIKFYFQSHNFLVKNIDIEQRHILEQDLLKELENFQTKVLKSISHEFGTPLNCAVNMLKICSMNVDDQIKNSYVLPALSSIRILKFSCSDFIDYSKIQFNLFKLDIRKTDLNHLLKKVVEYFQPLVEAQQEGKEGIQLQFSPDDEVPEQIMSDPQRIMQVIFNLLTNALKFTQKGFIKIRALNLNEDEIEISVQDSGIGIKADQQENLFERKTVRNRKQETSGLGLIISNSIAQRLSLNGTGLSLASKLGEGSSFVFTINCHCNNDFTNRKYDMNKRKQSQLSNKPSHSEYNTLTELNQTITPILTQYNPITQMSYVHFLHQQFPMSPLQKFNLNHSVHRKQSNELCLNGQYEILQRDTVNQNMPKQEKTQETLNINNNNNYLSPKRIKIEGAVKDQNSSFISDINQIDASCNECNLSEAISIKKEVNVPVSMKFCPSKQIKPQTIKLEKILTFDLDQKSISKKKTENREENSIHAFDIAVSQFGTEKDNAFGTEGLLGGIGTERCSGIQQNIQQINKLNLSGKFITNLDQKKNKEKNNPRVSIEIYLDTRNNLENQGIKQIQDKKKEQENNEINEDSEDQTQSNKSQEKIVQSYQGFNLQISNYQIESSQSIKQKNKQTSKISPENIKERNIIKSIQRVTNDQFDSNLVQQQNIQQQHFQQKEEVYNLKIIDQKCTGGILQSKQSPKKIISAREIKKKQIKFSNNIIKNQDESSQIQTKQIEQEQQLECKEFQPISRDQIQDQAQQNIFNYNFINENKQNTNQKHLNALNIQSSLYHNRKVQLKQNNLQSFKDAAISQDEQSQNNNKLNSPSYRRQLIKQLQSPNVSSVASNLNNDAQTSDSKQSINVNNIIYNTNDTYIKEINEKQSNIKTQNHNDSESDAKSPTYDFPSQLSPIEKKSSQQNPCETSLVDHIDSNDIEQQSNQISLQLMDNEKRSSKSNKGSDFSQIYQQIVSNLSNNRNLNSSINSQKSPLNYQQNQTPSKHHFFNQSNFDYGQILNLSNQFQNCELSSQNNLPRQSQNYLPQQSQNQILFLTQNYLPNSFNDHLSQGETPRSHRVHSFQLCLPTQKIQKSEIPLSAGYQKKSHHYSQQNILTTQFLRNNTQNMNSNKIQVPVKGYSEKHIALNDTLPPISSKMIESRQSVKKTKGQQNQGIESIHDHKSIDTQDQEASSPLRAKCFSLQEQFSVNNSQRFTQQDNQPEISQGEIRKNRRKRTKSEFGVHKNIQEIKDALKIKKCGCADILIADDTQMNRHTLKLMIQSRFPFLIEEATNGQEAFEKVQAMIKSSNHCKTYKMIFMDIDMPKLNGYEATQKINEIFKENNIFCPVIAHTAFDRSECEEEMNQCNMTDYAGKPISTAVIESLFARYIDVSQITGEQ